jgi:predicted metallopeptidase
MGIKFFLDEEIKQRVSGLVAALGMGHVDLSRLVCVRSKGSKSRRTIARCYALSKIWQLALDIDAHYVIEVIPEKFDRLNREDQDKVLLHELLHIPFSFGGGFKHHGNWVTKGNVDALYRQYLKRAGINERTN